jgi:4-hydroxy-tetrahydrodipicolinate synthase
MSLFTGLSAFPLTPATVDGIVDAEALGRLTARLVDAGVDSIGLLGRTGAYAYLTRMEHRRAVEVAVGIAGGRVLVRVGVAALRTDDACSLADDAARAGADALLLAPMSYTPLTDDEVFAHYVAVANATDLPLCIYNNPTTTRFTFGAELLGRLAGGSRIAAVKMPLPADGDVAAELALLRSGPAAALSIGYSADWGLADATLAGADGFYSAVGGILPRETLALFRAARTGDAAEARRIDGAFQPLWSLFGSLGGLRVIYAIANELSLCDFDPPRPILPLQPRDRDLVRAALCGIERLLA